MRPGGHNPMRWNCDSSGCFNIKRRPKIEVFSDCFPGLISFGDVDALVEVKGAFCLLEWKGKKANGAYPDLGTGQRVALTAFTRLHPNNVVFVVNGDAETMQIDSMQMIFRGKVGATTQVNLSGLKQRISAWAEWAKNGARAAA